MRRFLEAHQIDSTKNFYVRTKYTHNLAYVHSTSVGKKVPPKLPCKVGRCDSDICAHHTFVNKICLNVHYLTSAVQKLLNTKFINKNIKFEGLVRELMEKLIFFVFFKQITCCVSLVYVQYRPTPFPSKNRRWRSRFAPFCATPVFWGDPLRRGLLCV